MSVIATMDGVSNLMAKLTAIQNNAIAGAKVSLVNAVLAIQSTAIKSIQEHQTIEKTEKRYNPRRDAEVSEPLGTPNSDLGKLAQSIEFNIDEQEMTGAVGTNLKYGAYLEFGTQTMAPRPWLYPAVQNNQDAIKSLFQVDFQDALDKVTNGK